MPAPAGRAAEAAELALLDAARRAAANAYAPYSGFRVGAVVEAADGRRFAGVNVENASYPVGLCAERVALGALVTAGGGRQIAAVAVATAAGDEVLPCGACLQALAEFGEPVVIVRQNGGPVVFALRELLAAPFGPNGERAAGS